jgi:FtsZ-binding cell division protein ZapB
MNGLSGMEKFSHLEDKVYLTVEFVKKLREEKETAAVKAARLAEELARAREEHRVLESKVEVMLSERDAIQLKVEAMLDAMTIIDPEVAEAVGR